LVLAVVLVRVLLPGLFAADTRIGPPHVLLFAVLLAVAVAWGWRWARLTRSTVIDGQELQYRRLVEMPLAELESWLARADETSTPLVFEAALGHGPDPAWESLMRVLVWRRDEAAGRVLERLLPPKKVDEQSAYHPDRCLAAVGSNEVLCYVVGKVFLQRARALADRDYHEAEFEWNKEHALSSFWKLRALTPRSENRAVGAGLYEEALYLVFRAKVSRTE
jgi:hypothetical protein